MRSLGLFLLGCLCILSIQAAEYPAIGEDIYDAQADGQVQIDDAVRRAAMEHKFVVVIFGANYCKGCRALKSLLQTDPELSTLARNRFVFVHIDANKFKNRNAEVKERYYPGFPGVPSAIVLNTTGAKLAEKSGREWTTTDKKAFDPEKIRTSFQEWASLLP